MNSLRQVDLYQLLPAVYKLRDADEGFSLQGLVEVVQHEVDVVAGNIDQAYNNLFVETCEPWAIPYLAGIVGIRRNNLNIILISLIISLPFAAFSI